MVLCQGSIGASWSSSLRSMSQIELSYVEGGRERVGIEDMRFFKDGIN